MDKNPNNPQKNPNGGNKRKLTNLEWTLIFAAGILLLVLIAMLIFKPFFEIPEITPSTSPSTAQPTTTAPPTTQTIPLETVVETEPVMLAEYTDLYAQNPEMVGWIKIEDTPIDYPVMYTPDDPEKYVHTSFEGKRNAYGLPFVDAVCSMDPESQNLIIYGHNMGNGTMFAALQDYESEEFWKEHPIIEFSTLYEKRQYEIVAAFRDRVYFSYEMVFKFYQFVDARDEEHLQQAAQHYKEKAYYDTGVELEMDDNLITLVTCDHYQDYGRFVVVAREIKDDDVPSNG